jgi:soluble lytic murein transglycosylase
LHGFLVIIAASNALATAPLDTQVGLETQLESQRATFLVAYPAAQRGDTTTVTPYLEQLTDYPLYPDLLGALLRASLAHQPAGAIEAFQAQFPNHPEARLLARAQLQRAAKLGDWQRFLKLWARAPQQDPQMACHFVHAQINAGASAETDKAGAALWHVGHSQPKACDPVFATLKQRSMLTTASYWERLDLALVERQFGLAAYLARSLDEAARQRVRTWQQMFADPARTLAREVAQPGRVSNPDIAVLEAGLMRLAYRDRNSSLSLWEQLSKQYELPADLRMRLLRQAALGSAQRLELNAVEQLAQVPANATDGKVRQWRVRSALRSGDALATLRALDGLDDREAALAENRYWRARTLYQVGLSDQSQQVFQGLAEERGFYGFLASDWLGLPYAYGHTPTPMNPIRLQQLAADPNFIRARELFYVGLYGRGRQLWEGLVKHLDQPDQTQAALLANRWGWHSRAIATAGRAGLHHDLRLRFPIPTANWLADLPVEPSLVLSVARSESLFMPDARSSAGAIGLMQLMPATGKEVARKLGVNYAGLQTLVDPISNARLGSEYLNRMLRRFDQNKVLAAAAYNAGPHRVDRWLAHAGGMPAEVWLATIPYQETRQYVQRVLETATIMQWRLQGPQGRLTEALQPMPPRPVRQPIAQTQ